MARRKKGHGEEHENLERWLLTYADMITLLMAFFIMMYSMSVLNLAKFREVAFSIRSGFGGVLKGGGPHLLDKFDIPVDARRGKMRSEGEDAMREMQHRLNTFVIEENMFSIILVDREARGLVVSIAAEGMLFERGSARLTPRANHILRGITDAIQGMENDFLVEGHTCDLPIKSGIFPTNWELSTARASRVVRYFENQGIDGKRMAAVGYGESRPRVPNDSEEHRTMNRRVDIVLLSQQSYSRSIRESLPRLNSNEIELTKVRPVINKVWDVPDSQAVKGEEHE